MRRLTFVFREGKVEILSDQQVDMTMPPEPAASRGVAAPAFWYELRDAAKAVVHRLPARDPIPADTEVFSDDPDQSIQRVPGVPAEVVFTVVVPDLPSAEEIRLMRAAPSAEPAARTADGAARGGEGVEVGRFKLRTGG